jgi:hypothetical protein
MGISLAFTSNTIRMDVVVVVLDMCQKIELVTLFVAIS